jgi:hypothetical protein
MGIPIVWPIIYIVTQELVCNPNHTFHIIPLWYTHPLPLGLDVFHIHTIFHPTKPINLHCRPSMLNTMGW